MTREPQKLVIPAGYTLLRRGFPPFTSSQQRSPGLHQSAIINSLCVSLGIHDEDRDLPWNKLEMGNAIETVIAERIALEQPDRYYRIWDDHLQRWRNDLEVRRFHEIQGIRRPVYMTLDLHDMIDWAVEDVKLTWMSSRHQIDSTKLAKWWWQIKGYCYAIGSTIGRLWIIYARGDYSKGNNDIEVVQWEKRFTKQQLIDNWNMLMRHAETMDLSAHVEGVGKPEDNAND